MGNFIFKKVVIIGGGVGGLSCAISLCKKGFSPEDILILEREKELGGNLKYNLDGNYGLIVFNKFVTSYEFLHFLIEDIENLKINYFLNTYVSSIEDKKVKVISKTLGRIDIEFEVLIIASGSKQLINLGSYVYDTNILRSLTTGIFFQKGISISGLLLSKDVLLTGTSSRELFLAKRIILEGGNVKGIIEKEDRIISRDLSLINFMKVNNVNIYLNSTIKKIVKTSLGFQNYLDVLINTKGRTLKNILCGRIICPFKYFPENNFINDFLKLGESGEILINDRFMTSVPGIFSIGNCSNLYTNSDSIYIDSMSLSQSVYEYVNNSNLKYENINIEYDKNNINLITPNSITNTKNQKHIILLVDQNKTSMGINVCINGEKFKDFKFLRFENYLELLLNLENYEKDINTIKIFLE